MPRYLLTVDYDGGDVAAPMDEWPAADVKAHMDYYAELHRALVASGELVSQEALTGPEEALVVTADGVSAPVVTDGPYAEFKEMLAGYQLVDVATPQRAVEIAALISRVPGPGGVPLRQPIGVRRVLEAADIERLTS
jgi:hypothetical protein